MLPLEEAWRDGYEEKDEEERKTETETGCGEGEEGQKTDGGLEEETGEKMRTNDDKRRDGRLDETVGNPQFDLNSHVSLPAQTRETGPSPEKFLHLVFLDMPPRPGTHPALQITRFRPRPVATPATSDARSLRPQSRPPAPAASAPSLHSIRSTLPARTPRPPLLLSFPGYPPRARAPITAIRQAPMAACFAFHICATRQLAPPHNTIVLSKAFRLRFSNHAPNQPNQRAFAGNRSY